MPSPSLTVEDAEMLLRMYHCGEKVTLHLKMEDRNLGDFLSRNTIAELPGIKSQPVAVLSGHLDSWDLGVGASDDGGGSCFHLVVEHQGRSSVFYMLTVYTPIL